MQLDSIEIYNFKSFRGRHILQFSPFLAVIGPNGSGKSNVFDAILFVLGHGAKKLRQQNLMELINEGQKECYVIITFETDRENVIKDEKLIPSNENQTPLDTTVKTNAKTDTIVKVKRTIANNKTTYYINEQPISNKEFMAALITHGISLRPLQFVVQGEVELIAQKSPKEFVEILEDLRPENYKHQEEEATKNFEEMKTKIENESVTHEYYKQESKQLDDKLSVLMPQLHKHSSDLQNRYLNLGIRKKIAKIEAKQAKIKIKEFNAKMQLIEKPSDENLSEKKAHHKKLVAFIEKEIQQITGKYNSKSRNLIVIEGKNRVLQEKINKIKESNESEKFKDELRQRELERLQEELDDNNKDIEVWKTTLDKLNSEIEAIIGKTNTGANKLAKQISFEKILHAENLQFLDDYDIADIENMLTILFDYKSKYEISHNPTLSAGHLNINRPELLRNLTNEYNSIEYKESVYKDYLHKMYAHKKAMDELKSDRYDTLTELEKTKLQVGSQFDMGEKVTNVLKNVEGFYGKASSLYVIDEKYIVASLASGKSYLHSFVVDTTKTAEKCIEILKTRSLGRHNFLILDKITNKSNRLSKNNNLLSSMIQCDQTFTNLFAFIFGDTYVFETKDEAYRAAFDEGKRAVTLDGQLIEKSGLMSGGGFNFDKSKLNKKIDVLNAAISEIEKRIKATEDKLEACQAEIDRLRQLKSKKEELNDEIIRVTKELQTETQKNDDKIVNEYTKICSRLQELQSIYQARKDKFENSLPIAYKKLKAEISIIYDKIALTERRNEEIKAELLQQRTAKKPVFTLTPQNYELIDCTELQKETDALKEMLKEHGKRREEHIEQLKSIEKELSKLKNDRQKYIEEEVALANAINEEREILESANSFLRNYSVKICQLNEMFSQILALNKKVNELREKSKSSDILPCDKSKAKKHKELQALLIIDSKIPDSAQMIEEIRNICAYIEPENTAEYLQYLKQQLTKYNTNTLNSFAHNELAIVLDKRIGCVNAQSYFAKIKSDYDNAQQILNDIQKQRRDNLMDIYRSVNTKFKKVYQHLTRSGLAEIDLVDYLDPFEGFSVSVMPPKKSWRTIGFLSGGEKTITSLSLLFALHSFANLPFFVFDEIDAALDNENVAKVGDYLRTQTSQILIVSLRERLFEKAEHLLGVYKVKGETHTVPLHTENIH